MRKESEKVRYRKALEFIVANSTQPDDWYVTTALNALGEDHPYYTEVNIENRIGKNKNE